MDTNAIISGESILELIPQRPPMVMVDTLFRADDSGAETGLTVLEDNLFCLEGKLLEPGLIEHAAQSAAAFAGYKDFLSGQKPKIGLIGEISRFRIIRLPHIGEKIRTSIRLEAEVFGMSLVHTESFIAEEKISEGTLKIFIPEG